MFDVVQHAQRISTSRQQLVTGGLDPDPLLVDAN